MARTHAKVKSAIWGNAEWTALTPVEQWTYIALLSQPKTSLVGILPYLPMRWASLSAGLTHEAVETAIEALQERRFILVDRSTCELLIRTFVAHDGIAAGNSKLLKGLWGAWEAVESQVLRKVAVDNMPESVFGEHTPPEAMRLRRSQPMDWPFHRAIEGATEAPTEPTCLLPPSSGRLHPESVVESIVPLSAIPSEAASFLERRIARLTLTAREG